MSGLPEINWRPRARADLGSIFTYIAQDNPDAAETMRRVILDKISRLPANPRAYRMGRMEGTRELVVHPNYIVIYKDIDGHIEILRVLHAAQSWP